MSRNNKKTFTLINKLCKESEYVKSSLDGEELAENQTPTFIKGLTVKDIDFKQIELIDERLINLELVCDIFKLLPWQRILLIAFLASKNTKTSYFISIPRQNGKSFLQTAILVYKLLYDSGNSSYSSFSEASMKSILRRTIASIDNSRLKTLISTPSSPEVKSKLVKNRNKLNYISYATRGLHGNSEVGRGESFAINVIDEASIGTLDLSSSLSTRLTYSSSGAKSFYFSTPKPANQSSSVVNLFNKSWDQINENIQQDSNSRMEDSSSVYIRWSINDLMSNPESFFELNREEQEDLAERVNPSCGIQISENQKFSSNDVIKLSEELSQESFIIENLGYFQTRIKNEEEDVRILVSSQEVERVLTIDSTALTSPYTLGMKTSAGLGTSELWSCTNNKNGSPVLQLLFSGKWQDLNKNKRDKLVDIEDSNLIYFSTDDQMSDAISSGILRGRRDRRFNSASTTILILSVMNLVQAIKENIISISFGGLNTCKFDIIERKIGKQGGVSLDVKHETIDCDCRITRESLEALALALQFFQNLIGVRVEKENTNRIIKKRLNNNKPSTNIVNNRKNRQTMSLSDFLSGK